MCGINGIISNRSIAGLAERINLMDELIYHRGPDEDGVYVDAEKVAFGMRRLSIIDLMHGKQPIKNEDGSLVIVFNGEIYNYRELKQTLVSKGISFHTSSDTEVILKLYELYGQDSVKELNGMFAFSIHDKRKKQVFIARDRFGEKPVYYAKAGDEVIWASELKSIVQQKPEVKKISQEALQLFLSLSYIPAPHTIYQDVYKLEPGCSMVIDTDTLDINVQKYWDIKPGEPADRIDNYTEATRQVQKLLFDSVEKRMIADVPIGVFLSGGVDSTIIASIMSKLSSQKIKTFTVGYANKRYDESGRAAVIAKKINSEHYECMLDYNEVIADIDKVILNYDEPYADPSCLPTYFISDKTSAFVKVALTGDGGDEVFGGYNKYLLHTYGRLYQNLVPKFVSKRMIEPALSLLARKNTDTKSFLTRTKKMFDSLGGDGIENHLNVIQLGFKANVLKMLWAGTETSDINQFLKNILASMPGGFDSNLKSARYIDAKISLEGDLLVKVDRASMLTSLECRAPFLDHRLIEFSYHIPDSFLIKGSNKKRILKDSFAHLLPEDFFKAPKSGFEIPIGEWLRNELKNELLDTLSEKNMSVHAFFNTSYVKQLIDEHLSTRIDHSWKLWTLFCFQKWYNANH